MKTESFKLINQAEINYFLYRIKKRLPNFVAGVITDYDGFPIGANISKRLWIHENTLALSAISKNREFSIKDPNLVQIRLDIDKSKKYKLFLLLEKSKNYKEGLKNLKDLIRNQELF
ncbi:MAG: hypothetical protein ACTSRH_02815 [Promethearchaeota archaeon]